MEFTGQQDVTTPFASMIGEVRVDRDEDAHVQVVAPGVIATEPGGQALHTVSLVIVHGS